MTNPKWLAGILTAFLLLELLCGTLEGVFIEHSVPETLITFVSLNIFSATWWGNLKDVFLFDYSFFYGDWLIVRYIFVVVGAAMVVSYAALLLPQIVIGLRSIAGGIVGLFTGGR